MLAILWDVRLRAGSIQMVVGGSTSATLVHVLVETLSVLRYVSGGKGFCEIVTVND